MPVGPTFFYKWLISAKNRKLGLKSLFQFRWRAKDKEALFEDIFIKCPTTGSCKIFPPAVIFSYSPYVLVDLKSLDLNTKSFFSFEH